MPQNDLQEKLHEAFKSHQERAREKARQKGKTEVTQEEYESHPLIRLQKIYERWHLYSGIEKEYSSLMNNLAQVNFSFFEVQRFHEVHKNSSLEYSIFMCAIGSSLRLREKPQTDGTELHLFFESKSVLPQLFYISEHSGKAQVKFEGLDTVILTGCEWASLSEYDGGKLVVDCDGPFMSIGSRMKSGTLKITQRVKHQDIGWEMQGGTITYDGDFADESIGERMKGGTILIKGDVRGKSDVGREMESGDIVIEGNYNNNESCIWGLGYGMKGGIIKVNGNFSGYGSLGCYMSGGIVKVNGDVNGKIDVGTHNKDGSKVDIKGDCIVHQIGCLMEGGTIKIGGNAGANIASHMERGEVYIGKNVQQEDEKYFYPVGSCMNGGKIIIDGNVHTISNLMYGGKVYINGTFIDEYAYGGLGKVYERGRLIVPGLMARIAGKLERVSIQRV